MPWAKHWEIREHISDFYAPEEGYRYGAKCRYVILDYLLLRVNPRLRTFVGVETMMKDTGITSDAAIAGAISWLFDHGAIYNVPSRYRVGKEAELPNRKYVFQLTGIINLGGEWFKYLLFSQDDLEMMLDEWRSVGMELPVEPNFLLPSYQPSQDEGSYTSQSEGSQSEGEVLSNSSRSSKTIAGSPSPSAQSSSGDQEPIGQNHPAINSRNSTSEASNSNAAVKENAQPNIPDNVENEPLIKALKDAYNLESYKPTKRCWDKLQKGARVYGVTYASPLTMYVKDPSFKAFADERLKQLESFGYSVDKALSNIGNYSAHPDENNPKKMKGYHHWLRDHAAAVATKKNPSVVIVGETVFLPEGS